MNDKELEQRIERLEHVVITLASWLVKEIGTAGITELYTMLKERKK